MLYIFISDPLSWLEVAHALGLSLTLTFKPYKWIRLENKTLESKKNFMHVDGLKPNLTNTPNVGFILTKEHFLF